MHVMIGDEIGNPQEICQCFCGGGEEGSEMMVFGSLPCDENRWLGQADAPLGLR